MYDKDGWWPGRITCWPFHLTLYQDESIGQWSQVSFARLSHEQKGAIYRRARCVRTQAPAYVLFSYACARSLHEIVFYGVPESSDVPWATSGLFVLP